MAPQLNKQYLPLLVVLSLFAIFIFSHYPISPPPPSLSYPTHFLSPHPLHHKPPKAFSFTIKLLAFNRLSSLSRCLRSLSAAHYGGDTVNLHIFIDHFNVPSSGPSDLGQKLRTSRQILDFVDGFSWDFGEKLVHYRTVNVGLQAQWLEAWWPTSDDEFVFVVEDDLEASPLYYKFLKGLIHNYYYNHSNFSPWIYGASLQRPRFVPGKHGNKMNLDNGTRLFFYQLVGTWGQLLFPRPWKEFRLWYDDQKAKGIKPFLEGMVTTGWYKKMGEKIWTPWFIKFIHSHGYFNIYTNFLHERALSISHRDAGVNYGKTAGPDSQLLDENSLDFNFLDMQPLTSLRWYDFCFGEVIPGRVAKSLDEVGAILKPMKKHKPVLLVSLWKAPEVFIRNLICHFERLNIRNYIFMVPSSKSDLILDLTRRGHPVIDTDKIFDCITRSQKSSWGVIKEIMVKTYVIKKCLESGFDAWVNDWNTLVLSDNPLVNSTDATYDFYACKGSGFFFAKSSSSSRKIWDGSFVLKFTAKLESLVSEVSSLGEHGSFVHVLVKFSERYGVRMKNLDEIGFNIQLENMNVNQSVQVKSKMISWSPETDMSSVRKRLEELGMWIIDDDSSCKAVICHQS